MSQVPVAGRRAAGYRSSVRSARPDRDGEAAGPGLCGRDQNLEYRILVENRSPARPIADRMEILPPNAKFVRASPKPHAVEPEIQWQLGTLKGYGCQEITLVLARTDAEDITNCICVLVRARHLCTTTRQVGSGRNSQAAPGKGDPKESTKSRRCRPQTS